MPDQFNYHLFGLHIRSEIALPELPASDNGAEPDVEISLGVIPPADRLEDDYLLGSDGAGFIVEDLANYWVSRGSRIIVEPHGDAPHRNIRLYLLGSAMGMLLHQRGLLPLHANAIDIGGQAIAFTGHSGAGKSTLASAFHDQGFPVLADDVCVIGAEDGQRLVYPGIPRLRLSEEAMAAGGRKTEEFSLSYVGDDTLRKFDVPVPAGGEPLPLLAIYRLAEGSDLATRRLHGVAAADAVFANTYRGAFVRSGGKPAAHWDLAVRLIGSVPVFEFSRPRDLGGLSRCVDLIVEHTRLILEEKANLTSG